MRTAEELSAPHAGPSEQSAARAGGIATTAVSAVALAAFFFVVATFFGNSEAWDVLGAFVVGPALFLFTLPMLSRQAKREGDRTLMNLLVLALILKLLGAIVRYILGTNVYHGGTDAYAYNKAGIELADGFRGGNFSVPEGTTGTHFIELLTGIVYTFIGPTIIGGFLFFSWLGFLGLFFFYRAFTIAVPEGRNRTYARLVFFLPSLLVWPSSIGKESWMMFCLGIIALGAAQILSGKTFRGLPIAAIGLWWAALPRAHIAGLAGVALALGFVLRRTSPKLRHIAPIIKLLSLAVVVVAAVFFIARATEFVQKAGFETEGGLTETLDQVAQQSGGGKSNFDAPVVTSPSQAPLAIFTVLFRPTIADAQSPQALIAAAEGTFLALLTLVRLRWILAAARLARRRPYVTFSIALCGALILAFSAVSNLGILARERVQLLPFFFVLLAVPSKGWLKKREARELQARERLPASVPG